MPRKEVASYLRMSFMPTIWCPGCGHGIILGSVIRAIDDLGWSRDDTVLVSGIGCSARAPAYADFHSLQTTHGRALAFATGIKMYKPNLKVVCLLGDGDCAAIGGNHLLHAARRNIDVTVVVFNNNVYGMTGGQSSPTTPHGSYSTTAPFGNPEPELDICAVAASAGATFVARSTAYHVTQLTALVKKALSHKGFALVEALSPCPTGYGRRNAFDSAADMMRWLRDACGEGKIRTGELLTADRAEFCEAYERVVAAAKREGILRADEGEADVARGAKPVKGRYEIRISGAGGQGVIMAGVVLAEAAIADGLEAVQTQSYGPEARGGASRSEVIVSDRPVDFPEVTLPHAVICMTREAWDKFGSQVREDGTVITDSTFVRDAAPRSSARHFFLPLTSRVKESTGSTFAANMAALGALACLGGMVSREAVVAAVKRRSPARLLDANLRAFEIGYEVAAEEALDRPGH